MVVPNSLKKFESLYEISLIKPNQSENIVNFVDNLHKKSTKNALNKAFIKKICVLCLHFGVLFCEILHIHFYKGGHSA